MKWLMLPDGETIINIDNIETILIGSYYPYYEIKIWTISNNCYSYALYDSEDEAKKEFEELHSKLAEVKIGNYKLWL